MTSFYVRTGQANKMHVRQVKAGDGNLDKSIDSSSIRSLFGHRSITFSQLTMK